MGRKRRRFNFKFLIAFIAIILAIIIFAYFNINKEILFMKSSRETLTFFDFTTKDISGWENVYTNCPVSYEKDGLKFKACSNILTSGIQKTILIPSDVKSMHLYVCNENLSEIPILYLVIDEIFLNKIVLQDFVLKKICLDLDFDVSCIADDKTHTIKIILGAFKELKGTEGIILKAIYFSKKISINQILQKNESFIDFEDYLEMLNWDKEEMVDFDNGLKLTNGPCNELSLIHKTIKIKNETKTLEITICADYAGNDGTMAYIYVDDYVGKFYIPSNSCNTTYWNISRFADNEMHDIKIASYFFRNYSYENIYVKNISFLSDSNIEPFELISQEHDLIDPLKIKNWYQKNCSTCKICHMTTDITNCETPIIASKEILIPDDAKFLIILAYVGYAGNDGAKAKVYLDDELLSEFKIESESEKMIKIDVGKYSGSYHVLYLVPEVYGQCSAEMIYWERVELTNQ